MKESFKRIDLHCHSDASNKTGEALLNVIRCPESYSDPREVYEQARRRGMDFVTLTDHDSIEGALKIADRPDVIVSEELTCWFPEDHCKMHVLVFGLDQFTHEQLQSRSRNIYDVAEYIEQQQIAHAVAHPIYRQNDKLERWHLERLLLLFKGFECLNGAHSALHRDAFEPMLDRLTPQEIARLAETHGLTARWNEPWIKARTGGSDDHGLLNLGRTWTQFPADAGTPEDILNCLRNGRCLPGGEAGSSTKLAHTFYSVAVRYYSRHIMQPGASPNLATSILQTLAGERAAPSRQQLGTLAILGKLRNFGRKLSAPLFSAKNSEGEGTGIIKRLFLNSAVKRIDQHGDLFKAVEAGLPPLGEHAEMFSFVNSVNRDVLEGIASAIDKSIGDASFTGLFDSIAAVLAHQFVLAPYYFAVFHQNKERNLLRKITGQHAPISAKSMKVGLFTDTLEDINGVARFVRDIGQRAKQADLNLKIHTTANAGIVSRDAQLNQVNFVPLLSRPLPLYSDLRLNLPPVLEILEWADRQQFDVIHVSTPGPMGLCGWLVSKMLRVPMLATYHTDFPAYLDKLAGDHRVTNGATEYMKWFYSQASSVFARSSAYRFKLMDLGIEESKVRVLPACVNAERFNPARRDVHIFDQLKVAQPLRLLYAGRISIEKNLPRLAEVFQNLCQRRLDVALILAGDGPYRQTMQRQLAGLPAYFVGVQNDEQLARLYASSDLFVFPSRTDTLGQVVMEAQACGLPAVVSGEGGPKETVVDDVTGKVILSDDPATWCRAIEQLLDDEPRRRLMSVVSAQQSDRFSLAATFETFWAGHLAAIEPSAGPGELRADESRDDIGSRPSKETASL